MTAPSVDWRCAHLEEALADYLEGDLPPAARAAADAHLAECDACAALVADLRAVAAHAAALPAVAPARDLWAGIEARLETPVVSLADRCPAAPARRPVAFTTRRLAAAAAALMLATSGATWWLARGADAPVVASGPQVADAPRATPVPRVEAPAVERQASGAGPAEPRAAPPRPNATLVRAIPDAPLPDESPAAIGRGAYDRDVAALRALVSERRADLDTGTVAVLERNLRIIDAAIAESRAALARDPRSPLLGDQLQRAMTRKVDLLRTLATLPRT